MSSTIWEATEFEESAFQHVTAEYYESDDEFMWDCPGCGIHCGSSPNISPGTYVYICGDCGEKFCLDVL